MNDRVAIEVIEKKIYCIRSHKMMLDSDLALLYGVETGALNRAVKRNADRFPYDFMFQLTSPEFEVLRCQFGILENNQNSESHPVTVRRGRGKHRKYLPYAFTEQGVAMLSSVLRSKRAVVVNIAIMRTFVKLREMLSTNEQLALQLDQLEKRVEQHDEEIQSIFEAIRQLMRPHKGKGRRIGFRLKEDRIPYGTLPTQLEEAP